MSKRISALMTSAAHPPASKPSQPAQASAKQPHNFRGWPPQQSRGSPKRRGQQTRRNAGSDAGDDSDGDAEPDELVPDPIVCREFGISSMTLWRWDHDVELKFPPPIVIRKRKFRIRRQLEAFKQRLLRRAIERAEATVAGKVEAET